MTNQTTHTQGKPLHVDAINTIITMVTRIRQPVTIRMESGREYDIIWNHRANEPELIEPGTTAITTRGVTQVLKWLESQKTVNGWFTRTEYQGVPEDAEFKSADVMILLGKQSKQVNASDAHFTMNNIMREQGMTGVVSVYVGIKPAHMVLDELYKWAESHDEKLAERIVKIESDMSWNEST